jgi:hypothetical protein
MKHTYGVVAAIIHCLDCEWEAKSYKNAQASAAIHAMKYKHHVEGEITIYITYDGREASK